MILETPTIEADFFNVLLQTELGNLGTDQLGSLFVVAGPLCEFLADFRGEGGGCGEGGTSLIVDNLGVDVLVGAENG